MSWCLRRTASPYFSLFTSFNPCIKPITTKLGDFEKCAIIEWRKKERRCGSTFETIWQQPQPTDILGCDQMKSVPRRQPYCLLPSCRQVSGKEGASGTSLGNSRSKDNWFLNENTVPTTPRSQEESYCPLSLEHSLRGQAPPRGHWSRGVPQVRADLYLLVHRWVPPSRVCPETRSSACQPRPQRCPQPVRVKAAFIQVAPQSLLPLYAPGSHSVQRLTSYHTHPHVSKGLQRVHCHALRCRFGDLTAHTAVGSAAPVGSAPCQDAALTLTPASGTRLVPAATLGSHGHGVGGGRFSLWALGSLPITVRPSQAPAGGCQVSSHSPTPTTRGASLRPHPEHKHQPPHPSMQTLSGKI